jgi:hypothetical protein
MRSRLAAIFMAFAAVGSAASNPACAAPIGEARGAFSRFVSAQNAHDLNEVGKLLGDFPDFLWISPGYVVRGRDAALERFRQLFQGTWRVDPDWSTFQVLRLDISTLEIFVRVSTSSGAPPRKMLINMILVNTAQGWRVMNIVSRDLPPA